MFIILLYFAAFIYTKFFPYYFSTLITMKKLLLLFILSIALVSRAQESLESNALQIGHWNDSLEKYVYGEVKSCDVKFLLQGDIIIANDVAESIYNTYETIENSENSASWKALDGWGREVIVSLCFIEDGSFFLVLYDDVSYKYFLTD
jgi:hypothetical protein